jgi:signal transduction histidine kinase
LEERGNSEEKAKELDLLKSRFISLVSHEFRTPLTTILSSIELLENYSEKLVREEKNQIYCSIKHAIDRMTMLLDNVSILGKVDSGKMTFSPEPVDLERFFLSLTDELKIDSSRIIFSSEGMCNNVSVDKGLLRNILLNILLNALRYSPGGTAVSCLLICNDREISFIVKDKGIGIPQEEKERVFEAFHRAKNVGNIPGTGLGFTIVRRCLELHRGNINILSSIGEGTTVTITVPLC